jgi:DNA-binding transcriptional LysR family regulator
MEIKQLRYFRQVYESGSFSKASEELGITQQGLSLSIEKLENEIGVIFFLRGKKGVEPTEIAAHFKKDISGLIDSIDSLTTQIQAAGREVNGIVKIALTPGVVTYFVPRLVSEFHELHPHIDLKISEMSDATCETSVASGECDIACLMGPVKTKGLDWAWLFEDTVRVMMKRENPLASRETLRFADLKGERFIMPPTDFRWHQIILDRCAGRGYTPKISYVSGDLSLTYSMIIEGDNISFVNSNVVSTVRPDETETVMLAPEEGLSFRIGLIWKKGGNVGYATKILIDYIREVSIDISNSLDRGIS